MFKIPIYIDFNQTSQGYTGIFRRKGYPFMVAFFIVSNPSILLPNENFLYPLEKSVFHLKNKLKKSKHCVFWIPNPLVSV